MKNWIECKNGQMPEDFLKEDIEATDLVVAYDKDESDAHNTFRFKCGDEWMWDDEQQDANFTGFTHWRYREEGE